MTPEERRNPSYHLRVAPPADRQRLGVTTADINALLKDFEGARKMMRTMMGGKRVPGMKVPTATPPKR